MSTATNKRRLTDFDVDDERHSGTSTSTTTAKQSVFKSSPITDRSSTFIAHFHPHDTSKPNTSTSMTQTIKTFQNDQAFSSADHRIAAWRRASTQRTLVSTLSGNANASANSNSNSNVTYTTNSDDDGEKYAGKRLEKVLVELNVQGTVIVARWYGGVLLGPVRFTHIENVAREAIAMWRRSLGVGGIGSGLDSGSAGKRLKTHDGSGSGPGFPSSSPSSAPPSGELTEAQKAADEEKRVRLAEQLVHRDNSIVVLRAMLAEMKEKKQKPKQEQEQKTRSSPGPGIMKANDDTASQASSLPVPPLPSSSSSPPAVSDPDLVSIQHTDAPHATPTPTPAPATPKPQTIDYTQMPLPRLRQLEKARDATIAFILKHIEKAEADAEVEAKSELQPGVEGS